MPELAKAAPLSGNAVIDGLMNGGAWSGPAITYGFLPGDINKNGVNDFDEGDWKDFYREITGNVETFANVNFQEVSGRGNINFRLDAGGGGESGMPVPGTSDVETAVGIDLDVAGAAAVVRLGTFSTTWLHEIGHSLGLKHPHDEVDGVFPKLPGVVEPGDKGTTYLNSELSTVMGYTFSFLGEDNPFTDAVDFGTAVNAQPGSFGAIDIAALQHLYGARAHNTGADTYRFSDDIDVNHGYTTIWDTGGIDTIEYAGTSRAKIDLRAATLQHEIGGGGWVSTSQTLTGGFTIAHGVVIENATGASNDDILIGNAVANTLRGLAGNDRLDGGAGDDTLDGGAGNDTLDGGAGQDRALYRNAFANYALGREGDVTIISGEGVDRLSNVEKAVFADGVFDLATHTFTPDGAVGNVLEGDDGANTLVAPTTAAWTLRGLGGDDVLVGNNGNDTLLGGAGNDRLHGGRGNDRMEGGAGDDTFVVDATGDVVRELAGQGVDRVETTISYKLTANVENLVLLGSNAISGVGNELANALYGNDAANTLRGEAGNDWLDGRGGADLLHGGQGDDYYVVDNARDRIFENAGEGIDHVQSSISFRLGGNLENLYLTGTAGEGTGNGLANTLVGSEANNILRGEAGDDILIGAGGDDRLFGGTGTDILTGGSGRDLFVFARGDSSASFDSADRITDFAARDRFDLRSMETGGDLNLLHFVGREDFSGSAGEVRYGDIGGDTFVQGDLDGNGQADFSILLTGRHTLASADFVL